MPPPVISADPLWSPPADPGGLGAAHRSIPVRTHGSWFRRLTSFLGPGYLVAVGYMDPGNWATDLAGGSAYGYALLWIVLLSSLMAMFLQVLAAKLGIVSGMDLAQICRARSSRTSAFFQWVLCEIAICACDLAEVIGTAIALKLLFDIPLAWGVTLTVFDVLLVLWLQQHGFRYLEALIIALLGIVFVCFAINLALAQPEWRAVASGFIPSEETLTNPGMLFIAIGIIGATVMPHNLYLHSSTVQTRRFARDVTGKKSAITFASVDIIFALCMAFFINAAILITAAAVFHTNGYREVAELQEAYKLLGPLTGVGVASVLFALALLASGQSSSITATLAGQIIMEGYVRLSLPPWARRLLTRSLAIMPALFVTLHYGESGIARLLLLSQVILSLQLPFAVIPLVRATSSKQVMGEFANRRWVVAVAALAVVIIISLNAILVYRTFISPEA